MTAFFIGTNIFEAVDGARHEEAMTMAFVSLALIQLFHAYSMRSQDHSILNRKLFANKYINLSFIIGVALTVFIVVVPKVNTVFGTVMLNGVEWAISIAVAVAVIPCVEIYKLIVRIIQRQKAKKMQAVLPAGETD